MIKNRIRVFDHVIKPEIMRYILWFALIKMQLIFHLFKIYKVL